MTAWVDDSNCHIGEQKSRSLANSQFLVHIRGPKVNERSTSLNDTNEFKASEEFQCFRSLRTENHRLEIFVSPIQEKKIYLSSKKV